MKLRLLLSLFFACSLLAGRAMAQGCSTTPITFPTDGTDKTIAPGTCIANADSDSPTGQGGRLRWDDASNHELVLFDSEHGGNFLWCAGGAGNANNCSVATILCAQHDGNLVMYASQGGNHPACVNDGNGGVPVWASNTDGDNNGDEVLKIEENVVYNNALRTGERVVIRNGPTNADIKFVSLGYVDTDPT